MKSGDSRLLGPIIRTFSLLYDLCYLAHLCSLAGYLALAPGPAPAGVLLALQHHRIYSTIISLLNRQFLVVCAAIALVLFGHSIATPILFVSQRSTPIHFTSPPTQSQYHGCVSVWTTSFECLDVLGLSLPVLDCVEISKTSVFRTPGRELAKEIALDQRTHSVA